MDSVTAHSEILIVGAGIFGTSTAYHLSKSHPDPSLVTVIDRTPFPPEHAASTDINKIIRADYSDPFYMELAYEALEAWATWPELAGKGYHHRTGWINFSLERDDDLARCIRQNFRERGSDLTKDVSLDSLKVGYNGLFKSTDFDLATSAYWNPDCGWCNAGLATAELMKSAIEAGVNYITGEVAKVCLGPRGVEGIVLANGHKLTADKVVLATGAWTSYLMSSVEMELHIPEDDCVEQQVHAAGVAVAHFKLTEDENQVLNEMPVIIWGPNGDIQPHPETSLLKITNGSSFVNTITTETGRKISAPPERSQSIISEKLKRESDELIVNKVLPQYTNRPAEYWRLCWDACTPTQDHLITKHPHEKLSNLYFAVGGSFHSYKFLPNAGKYVINVLYDKSNGAEKDDRWAWKSKSYNRSGGAHEKAYPTRDLSTLED